MTRIKTFDNTGIATAGRLYAGDLNLMQDQYSDAVNFGQTHAVGTLQVGESGLQLLRYGVGEARLSGMLRTDGILRGLGGLYAGAFTTAQRDAIPANSRPYGLIILNTTTNQIEWNKGTDPAPNWQPVSVPLTGGMITNSLLAANSVTSDKIVDGSVTFADLEAALKPSQSAGAGTEALRALGVGANNAAAGNDARFSDARPPTANSITNTHVQAGAGIVYSKLALANSILNNDIVAGAGIPLSKLNLTGSITDNEIAAGNKDGARAGYSMRSLGMGSQQAAPGSDFNAHTGGTAYNHPPSHITGSGYWGQANLQGDLSWINSNKADKGVGGVLSGSLPNPGFAQDMATQVELDAVNNARASGDTNLQNQISAMYQMRAGSVVVTGQSYESGQAGWFSFNFEAPFPNACLACVMGGGDANVRLAQVYGINSGGKSRFGISGIGIGWSGTWDMMAGTQFRIEYIAMGY